MSAQRELEMTYTEIDPALTPSGFIKEIAKTRRGRGMMLYEGLNNYGARKGASPNLIFGVYNYARRWNLHRVPLIEPPLQLLDEINDVTGLPDFFKSRSFNYLSDEEDPANAFHQAVGNANRLVELVGEDFFATQDRERATIFKAPIAGTKFFLSCKGGSGAGTFSLDFAIGMDWGQPFIKTSGELWRTGIDTESTTQNNTFGTRIIRTGSAVRKDPDKIKGYPEFRKIFKISPQRALAFLSIYFSRSIGAEQIDALTTEGAIDLSTLGRSRAPYGYTGLFEGVGFNSDGNPHWLTVRDLHSNFYNVLETTHANQNGLRAHETCGMHHILEAFQNLANQNGQTFPIQLVADESRTEIEKVLIAFQKIHGWRTGH